MGSAFRFARWGLILRSALAVAGAIVVLAPAAAIAAPRFVYVSNGFPAGSDDVSALRINSNGTLTPVTGSPFDTPGQTATEGITMSPDAKNVYVAHFGTNNISQFTVNANGGLSPVAGSATDPAGTNANGVNVLGVAPDPDGGHLFGWNHGSAIAVLTRNQATGALSNIAGSSFAVPATQINPFAGSVAPDGDHLYVPNENSSETVAGCGGTCEVNRVTPYSVAANGQPSPIQGTGVITGSTNVNANGPNPFGSGITPDGRFLYVSNPEDGPNGRISGFAVNANGTLSNQLFNINASPGNHPLNMAVSPDGQNLYVATRISRTVNAYTINNNGTLTTVPGQPFATGAADVNGKGIALTPDGKRLYVSAGGTDDRVFGFERAANGALTQIAGGTGFPTGGQDPDLESIAITPNQAPIASFTSDAAPAGQPTGFDAGASSDVDNTGPRYDWTFGDGTTLADGGPVPNHIYAAPGTFTVNLTLTDKEGCSTQRIFTGKAMLCNGSQAASINGTVTIPPAVGPQAPPPNSFSRTLSISFKKNDALFKGAIDSENRNCERNQTVELFKKKGGNNKRTGSDATDATGEWQIAKKKAKGKFFAEAGQTTLPNGDTCLAATSKTVKAKKKN